MLAVVGTLVWTVYPRIQERVERNRLERRWEASRLVYQGDLEGLQTFLDAYALDWLEPPGRPGKHGLIIAASGQRNIEMVQLLIDHGADVNGEDYYGITPLLDAIRTQDPQYYPEKGAEMVQFLIDQGADPRGAGYLAAAVTYGDHDALQVLLKHGADPQRIDHAMGKSAVELAREIECAKCLELFEEPPPKFKTNPRDFEYRVE